MARLGPEIAAAVKLAALLGLIGALGPFLLVLLKTQVYSLVLPTASMGTAWGLATGFAIGAVAVVALAQLRDLALVAIGNRLARRLAVPALLAASERRDADPAATTAQALHDIEEVRRGVTGTLCAFVLDAVLVPSFLLLLAWFHWAFALFGLAAALLALGLGVLGDRLTRQALIASNQAAAQGARLVSDAVRCAEAVEAHGMLPALVRRWAGTLGLGADRLRRAQAGARLTDAAMTTLQRLAGSGAMVVGALVVLQGSDIGYGIIAGSLLTGQLMAPFAHAGGSLDEAAAARAAWARLDALLRAADAAPPREARDYPCPEGRLSVERVTLVHPGSGRALLRDVSLEVAPGEVVALAGPPGTGKSTLLRVILGVQGATAGAVYLDGHATAHWERGSLARFVGYLPQDPVLPAASVASVIARLDPRPDMAAVLRAARLADAEQLVAGLPHGFATRLDGTLRLSMGQRQRIALARAVFGGPRLVLLDEPSAWLDEAGEAAVARMIAALSAAGTAVIFASHREALVAQAMRRLTLKEAGWALAALPSRTLPVPLPALAAARAPARLLGAA
ncbi:ATP-binding cassette domain-containing protein [Falsiroseomonas sp. HW251]|uniref:ATP-binding cassette domain-containing protein n=1 Tax=Falsiroseomonas sp. HW251 TaxID=3390998 RepID=UPI003D315B72